MRVSFENFTELFQFWSKPMSAVEFLPYPNLNSSFSDLFPPISPPVPNHQPPFTTTFNEILCTIHLYLSAYLSISLYLSLSIYLSIIYLSIYLIHHLPIYIFVHAIASDNNNQPFIKLCTGLRSLLTWFRP